MPLLYYYDTNFKKVITYPIIKILNYNIVYNI